MYMSASALPVLVGLVFAKVKKPCVESALPKRMVCSFFWYFEKKTPNFNVCFPRTQAKLSLKLMTGFELCHGHTKEFPSPQNGVPLQSEMPGRRGLELFAGKMWLGV